MSLSQRLETNIDPIKLYKFHHKIILIMSPLIFSLLFSCLYAVHGYQTRTPTRFSVDKSVLKDIIPSVFPFVLRLGTGALISGYKVSIVEETDENKNDYTFLSALGYRLKEETSKPFINRPKKLLEVYEFEGCPFCKKVREAVCLLDLDVVFYPCPRDGPTFRPKVMQLGGKAQFPYLIDPNTDTKMYESENIIKYLYDTYGNGEKVPGTLENSFFPSVSLALATVFRLGKGSKYVQNSFPVSGNSPAKKPLIYWGYEGSPFCKIVREKLVDFEIPHVQRTCPRGSAKRSELVQKTGRFQVPYLEDPNTGVQLFESADILDYLNDKYAI